VYLNENVRVGHQKGLNGRQTYNLNCKGEEKKKAIKYSSFLKIRGRRFQINPGISNHFSTLFGWTDKQQF